MELALYYSVPAAVIALFAYLELRPPDLDSHQRAFLRIGLALGICAWLVVLLVTLTEHMWPTPGLWRSFALASGLISNGMNVVAIVYCLRERSAQSLLAALLLGFNQLALMFFTFATQIP